MGHYTCEYKTPVDSVLRSTMEVYNAQQQVTRSTKPLFRMTSYPIFVSNCRVLVNNRYRAWFFFPSLLCFFLVPAAYSRVLV